MTKILLIISGSIAAYKAIDLARNIEDNGYNLDVIITTGALDFITPLSIKSLIKGNVYTNQKLDQNNEILHTKLGKYDLVVVAPATQDFIAKIASGFANELALEAIAACSSKVIIVPAMNVYMYQNKITQMNINKLKENGFGFIEPISGKLACGDVGFGKYAGNDEVIVHINNHFKQSTELKGKKIVITLGSTREYIDPVRYISNESSGEQGVVIANEFLKQGAEVTIIAGYIKESVFLPSEATIIRAYNASEFLKKSKEVLPVDVYISTAAIADFKPKNPSNVKLKKSNFNNIIEFEQNSDVVKEIANGTTRPAYVIGFALETDNLLENAKQKFNSKNLDFIIGNSTQDFSNYSYITWDGISNKDLGKVSKKHIAEEIVNYCLQKFKK
ncbi:MAG: bifunctional phosphopantothenoylcysteine decarboxylase/phosphopantothenate--cysteine ligase CoaBC [Sphingobacteriia bacterium]|nr:bifunctional phosphopantothenoylcysteine decarboxylase/phosphopantothenate--cysteine ligase CoaBC [Sphingobacteriia bacterium]